MHWQRAPVYTIASFAGQIKPSSQKECWPYVYLFFTMSSRCLAASSLCRGAEMLCSLFLVLSPWTLVSFEDCSQYQLANPFTSGHQSVSETLMLRFEKVALERSCSVPHCGAIPMRKEGGGHFLDSFLQMNSSSIYPPCFLSFNSFNFLLKDLLLFCLCVCMCICVCMCTHVYLCLRRPEVGVGPHDGAAGTLTFLLHISNNSIF